MSKLYVILVLAFILRVTLALRDDANLTSRLHNDDSFYLHTVSKNIGFGNGFTIDGKHLTNGVQPLVVVMNAPFYSVASPDRWLGLRLSFILSAAIDCLTILFLFKLVKGLTSSDGKAWLSPPMIASMMWAFSYPVMSQTMNGMETGILSLFIITTLYFYSKYRSINRDRSLSAKEYSTLGVLLGFMVLARIDTVIFTVMIFCYELFLVRKKIELKPFILPVLSFLISSPWWIYNYVVFGSLMPTSGSAESINGASLSENVLRALTTLTDTAFSVVFLPYDKVSGLYKYIWILLGAVSLILLLRSSLTRKSVATFLSSASVKLLLIYGVVILLYYVFFFHAPYFIPRYAQPLRIVGLLVVSHLLYTFIMAYRGRTSKVLKLVAVCLSLVVLGFNISFYGNNFLGKGMSELYYAGLWAKAHPNALVGMQQSGTAGFVADNVVNLDGKVNAEVLRYMKRGERGKYIAEGPITHIADWYEFADVLRIESARYGNNYRLVDSFRLLSIYERVK